MKKILLVSTLIGALALQGCATGTMQPQGAGKSSAIGAVIGAAAGAIAGCHISGGALASLRG